MTTQALSKRIDVDTHFYPPVDAKVLRAYLPCGLASQARDMLVYFACRIESSPNYYMLYSEEAAR